MTQTANLGVKRWFYLAAGTLDLLFAGIIYGWSILKVPLAEAFGWSASDLAINFTLTMSFFCAGGIVGGALSRRRGVKLPLIMGGVLAGGGFFLAGRLSGSSVVQLYVTYGVMAGLGIGIAYNIIISTVGAWFPDKKGTCSGTLMMGFGASALVVGSLASALIESPGVGWRGAYTILGACLAVLLILTALVLTPPDAGTVLPPAPVKGAGETAGRDYAPGEMLRRGTFWRAFLCVTFLAAVGNTVISFARDLSLSVGAGTGLATTLVGVLSVCNGFGRILTGALFDQLGRRKTMLLANGAAIAAAGVTLTPVFLDSLPLCVAGLCATGVSYGSCPTISSAFISEFYGSKHFAMNFSIMNVNLMGASFMATAASMLLTATGSYFAPFTLLLGLSLTALLLNLSVKRP